jgi:tetratricopeptide (TPR) repeat protein
LFWKAEHRHQDVLKELKAGAPMEPARVAPAVRSFEQVAQAAPGTSWAGKAFLMAGHLRKGAGLYAEAREAYQTVLREFSRHQPLSLTARIAIADTYAREQQWDSAAEMYYEIADFHPWSTIGIEAPMTVALLHERQGNAARARQAYQRAAGWYVKLMANAPSPESADRLKAYLAVALQRTGEWEKALELLEDLAQADDKANRPFALLSMGLIYQGRQNNPAKAQEAFTALIADFPDHAYAEVAKEQLRRMTGQTAPPRAPAAPGRP